MFKYCILVIALFVFCITDVSSTQLKKRGKMQIKSHDEQCDPNVFMILSRQTGYHLSLALRFQNENGQKFYWTVTNQNKNSILQSYKWIRCTSGLKNLKTGLYLYIDGARNAVLVDYTEIKQVIQFNTDLYSGYTVIQINSQCLTTQTNTDPETNGATFFAANYKGGPINLELSQQWNIHYI